MIIVGAIGFWSLTKVNNEYRSIIDDQVTKMVLFEKLSSTQYEISNDFRGYLLFEKVSFLKNREELIESFNTHSGILDQMARSDAERVLLDELKESHVSYVEIIDLAISEFNNANDEKALNIASDAINFSSRN